MVRPTLENMHFDAKLSSEDLRTFYLENGFLVLHQAIPLELCDRVNTEIDYALTDGRDQFGDTDFVVLRGADANKRMFLRDIKSKYRDLPFKLNNIYRYSPIVRTVALQPAVRKTLTLCLAGTPVIVNSLNLIRGSQQPTHNDSWYMPPRIQNGMAVASVCLEDIHPTAGPLFYFPGSHTITPYSFRRNGKLVPGPPGRAVRGKHEKLEVTDYYRRELQRGGFRRKVLSAKKGDVFIWHGELLHGGTKIENPSKTRRTLVTHYHRAEDIPQDRIGFIDDEPAFLLKDSALSREQKSSELKKTKL